MKNLCWNVPAMLAVLTLGFTLTLAGCDYAKVGEDGKTLTPVGGTGTDGTGQNQLPTIVREAEKAVTDLNKNVDEHSEMIKSTLEEGKKHMSKPAPQFATPDDLPPPPTPPEFPQAHTTLYPPPGPEDVVGENDDQLLLKDSLDADYDEDELDLAEPVELDVDEDFERAMSEEFNRPILLGDPIFEKPENLVRLDEKMTVWVDKDKKNVVLQGWICQTRAPLEFFMCTGRGVLLLNPYDGEEGMPDQLVQFRGAKTHEAVVCVDVRPSIIHAGLLAIGARPGEPVRFQPEFKPATGAEIEVILRWKKEDGEIVEKRAQDVVMDAATGEPMDIPWVFAGSFFYTDDEDPAPTPKRYYAADSEGEIIGVSNFPSATLDVPKASSAANAELLFQANQDALPERGTPVTILLRLK